MSKSVPHPIPYQGSKRRLASEILRYFPQGIQTLYEPFAGSGAVSLAALQDNLVQCVHLGDSFGPLMELWEDILRRPEELLCGYTDLWEAQQADPKAFYEMVRARFNRDGGTHHLLYLLARCVKNAVRFNRLGQFNQSADHRRLGTKPQTMGRRIHGAHRLMVDRATLTRGDYQDLVARATRKDLVYLDPPYEGTSGSQDHRYFQQFNRREFVLCLEGLSEKGIPFIVSLDGRTGVKTYGTRLPDHLSLVRLELDAGPSTQATLHGRRARTIESLYLSPMNGRLNCQ